MEYELCEQNMFHHESGPYPVAKYIIYIKYYAENILILGTRL